MLVGIVIALVGKRVIQWPIVYEWYQIPTGRSNYDMDFGLSSAAHKTGPTFAGIFITFGLVTLWIAKDVK